MPLADDSLSLRVTETQRHRDTNRANCVPPTAAYERVRLVDALGPRFISALDHSLLRCICHHRCCCTALACCQQPHLYIHKAVLCCAMAQNPQSCAVVCHNIHRALLRYGTTPAELCCAMSLDLTGSGSVAINRACICCHALSCARAASMAGSLECTVTQPPNCVPTTANCTQHCHCITKGAVRY